MIAPLRRFDLRTALWGLTPLALVLVGDVLVTHQSRVRLLLLLLGAAVLFILATADAGTAILALFAFLPFLAMSRRMLITISGWPARDPLVLLGPLVLLILLVRAFVLERRPLSGTRLSQFVLALVVVAGVESLNPAGGGLSAGVSGFIYVGLPIMWFFVGREFLDEKSVRRLLWLAIPIGVFDGMYGMFQLSGLTSWDQSWVNVTGYAALIVGTTVRPFGTFSSSEEYATYLCVAIVISVAFAIRGRYAPNQIGLLAVPVLGVALFYESARGALILGVLGTFVVLGLTLGSPRKALAAVGIAVLLAGAALHVYSGTLNTKANATGSGYVTHQVGGLTHPLNSKQSTLATHTSLFYGGLKGSIRQPLGIGTAPISKGGTAFGAAGAGTEVDISDAFLGLGIAGGILFLGVMILAFRTVTDLYLRRRSNVALAACGVLVVTATGWLNGDLYAVTPLVWVLIGWADKALRSPELETA